MIQLYDYQGQIIKALRQTLRVGKRRLILCAPTGGGKTIMFSFMVKSAIDRGKSALIFTHRGELLHQAGGAFKAFGLEPEYIKAGELQDTSGNLHVAMVETFARRIDDLTDFLNSRDLIIFDEAHLQIFNKILDKITNPNVTIVGATATPIRKGRERCLSEHYDEIIQEIDTPELIKLGKLTPARSYGVEIEMKGLKRKGDDYDTTEYYDKNKTYKGVVWNYEQLSLGEKTILFASNIKSSKQVCEEFVSHGYNARHVDGNSKDREQIFQWFNDTPDAILCNCGIATTGFDQADILTVILYRATTSLALFMQMCGRGSRLWKGKDHFKILDFGNNIQRHGFWEQPRIWELEKGKQKALGAAAVKICKSCTAINYATAKSCIVCGELFPVPPKEKSREEVVLQLLIDKGIRGKKISELNVDELIVLQQQNVFKAQYIWRIVRTLGLLPEYAVKMKYSRHWLNRQNKQSDDVGFKDKML